MKTDQDTAGKALRVLIANCAAWLWFPEMYRKADAKRAYLKSKTKALIRHDRILGGLA